MKNGENGGSTMTMQPRFNLDAVQSVIEQHRLRPGALLPILHAIQDAIGYIPSDAVPLISEALKLSRAEVHGVITYYHHFRQQPPGKHVVQLCRAEACQAVGGDALAAHVTAVLGCGFHETTPDGNFTLEPVYCLGQCACGPSMMIDSDLHARVTTVKFDRVLQSKRGAP